MGDSAINIPLQYGQDPECGTDYDFVIKKDGKQVNANDDLISLDTSTNTVILYNSNPNQQYNSDFHLSVEVSVEDVQNTQFTASVEVSFTEGFIVGAGPIFLGEIP